MARPWFDGKTNTLLLDEYVMEMPSFKKIFEDGVVTDEEIIDQANRVVEIMKKLEGMLSDAEKEVTTDMLCELAVLYTLGQKAIETR